MWGVTLGTSGLLHTFLYYQYTFPHAPHTTLPTWEGSRVRCYGPTGQMGKVPWPRTRDVGRAQCSVTPGQGLCILLPIGTWEAGGIVLRPQQASHRPRFHVRSSIESPPSSFLSAHTLIHSSSSLHQESGAVLGAGEYVGDRDRHKAYVPAWGMSTPEKNDLGMQDRASAHYTASGTEPCRGWEHTDRGPGAGMCQV